MKTENVTHTPGPWRSGDAFNTVFGPPNGNPVPEIVATVHMNKANGAREGNARLIAAAPELLEAASACLKMFSEMSADKMASLSSSEKAAFDLSLFAIAKAEGRA